MLRSITFLRAICSICEALLLWSREGGRNGDCKFSCRVTGAHGIVKGDWFDDCFHSSGEDAATYIIGPKQSRIGQVDYQ